MSYYCVPPGKGPGVNSYISLIPKL